MTIFLLFVILLGDLSAIVTKKSKRINNRSRLSKQQFVLPIRKKSGTTTLKKSTNTRNKRRPQQRNRYTPTKRTSDVDATSSPKKRFQSTYARPQFNLSMDDASLDRDMNEPYFETPPNGKTQTRKKIICICIISVFH